VPCESGCLELEVLPDIEADAAKAVTRGERDAVPDGVRPPETEVTEHQFVVGQMPRIRLHHAVSLTRSAGE